MDSRNSSSTNLQDEWELVDDNVRANAPVASPHKGKPEEEDGFAYKAPEGFLSVRLRQGEEIRTSWFKATQQVDEFINMFFAAELANKKKVRLIYMGMLLLSSRTMGEYGIEENGVIHSVITDAPSTPNPEAVIQANLKPINPQNSLLLLTGMFLYGMWTLFYHFPDIFTWRSVVLLALFSAMHITAVVSRVSS
ncbi:putative transmembrane and ubiquitin-like domain-containing protein [Plasmopara halstedii]